MTYAITRKRGPTLVAPPKAREGRAIRRIFNNEQIIEKFDKWLLICGKAANTRRSYVLTVKQFAKFIEKPLTAATKEDVRDFIGSLYARNLAPSTMQARLDCLRVFFDCLQLGNQVRGSVARFIPRRKLPKRLPHALSEQEVERLIAAARTSRDRAILELGYASGLRVNELATLRVEDVDLKGRSLIVRQGKGGNDRIALFGRPAADAIRQYIGERVSGPLFRQLGQHGRVQHGGVSRDRWGTWWGFWRVTNAADKRVKKAVRLGDYEIPTRERARQTLAAFLATQNIKAVTVKRENNPDAGLTSRQIFRVVKQAAKRAGLTGVHPHTLRHSMATQKYLHVSTVNIKRVHAKFFPRG